MRNLLSFSLASLLVGCSLKPSHVGEPVHTKDGDEFSIRQTDTGFTVAGHYSEYQFVRSSRDGFIGCTKLINDAAQDYVTKTGQSVRQPSWEDVTIVDHGRDIITAVMNVNCEYTYQYAKPADPKTKVTDLKSLADLYERGVLTDSEFTKAKSNLLEN
ncbi:SHOCT domain-containing protein [Vibrio neonatus]|uniref:SHOCT domain-containing protein n=1 Tax=Vibrio neonatus TaxID=278860 RepID=UPI0021C3CB87|nr:SHOCT domain-containing protein [Vibrio neonatus]